MGEHGGVQRYLYWSDRRVRRLLEDKGIRIPEKQQRRMSTPNVRGFLPSVEWMSETSSATRPELAHQVEEALGLLAVEKFDSPIPVEYAKGAGTVIFGEFSSASGESTSRAVMYTSALGADGKLTGICLFGSVENFADFVNESGAPTRSGWTCSSAREVIGFLEDECRVPPSWQTREELARDALKIAYSQGESGFVPDAVRRHGWNRGYTYGDVLDHGEWLGEVYCDVDLSDFPQDGHSRVLIGAPLWLRTASLRAVRMYSDYEPAELDRASTTVRGGGFLRRLFRSPTRGDLHRNG